jgi:hypothetical protein
MPVTCAISSLYFSGSAASKPSASIAARRYATTISGYFSAYSASTSAPWNVGASACEPSKIFRVLADAKQLPALRYLLPRGIAILRKSGGNTGLDGAVNG